VNNTVDLQKIAEELEFDLEDVEMLFEVFLADANETLIPLREAVKRNDYENIFRLSHSIKGSASNILLTDIASSAQKIESNARENKSINYVELLEVLEEKIHLCMDS